MFISPVAFNIHESENCWPEEDWPTRLSLVSLKVFLSSFLSPMDFGFFATFGFLSFW